MYHGLSEYFDVILMWIIKLFIGIFVYEFEIGVEEVPKN